MHIQPVSHATSSIAAQQAAASIQSKPSASKVSQAASSPSASSAPKIQAAPSIQSAAPHNVAKISGYNRAGVATAPSAQKGQSVNVTV